MQQRQECPSVRIIWLLLLLCLNGASWAQVPPPRVTIPGILLSTQGPRAIVAGPNSTFIVQTGELLGDYLIKAIDAEAVTFGFREFRFRIALNPAPGSGARPVTPSSLQPNGPDDSIDLRLRGADRIHALKLLARINEQPICCGSTVDGKVDMEVQQGSLDATMEALAASGGQQLRLCEGILVAGDSATVSQKPWQIAGQAQGQGLVSLDFVNADLIYVLYILARELKVNAIIAPEVAGTFTITAKNLPPTRMLGLALWIQNQNYQASLDPNFLVVTSGKPRVTAAPAGNQPLLTVKPEMTRLADPVKVREVVKKVAALYKVQAVMPANFNPSAFISLERAPAGSALERILALHGYRFRLEKGQLLVEDL